MTNEININVPYYEIARDICIKYNNFRKVENYLKRESIAENISKYLEAEAIVQMYMVENNFASLKNNIFVINRNVKLSLNEMSYIV